MRIFTFLPCFVFIHCILCDNTANTNRQGDSSSNVGEGIANANSQDSGNVPDRTKSQFQNDRTNVEMTQLDPSSLPDASKGKPGLKTQTDNSDKIKSDNLEINEIVNENDVKNSEEINQNSLFFVSEDSVFEETGNEGESLVDQMNRLSEKIKKSQGQNTVTEMGESRDSSDSRKESDLPSSFHGSKQVIDYDEQGDMALQYQADMPHDQGREPDSGTPDQNVVPESRKFGSAYSDDPQKLPENVVVNVDEQNKKETVAELMKKLEKDIDEGNIYMPKIDQPYEEEEEAFPDDDALHSTNEGNDVNVNTHVQVPDTEVGIQNTVPPVTDSILATKTNEPLQKQTLVSSEDNLADTLDVRATPTLEELKKTVSDALVTTKLDQQIEPTANIPVESTGSKQAYDGKSKKQLRLEKHRRAIASATATVKESATHVHSHMDEKLETVEENAPQNLHLSATKATVKSGDVEIPKSEQKPTGMIYETKVDNLPPPNRKAKTGEEKKEQDKVMPTATILNSGKVKLKRDGVGVCSSGI